MRPSEHASTTKQKCLFVLLLASLALFAVACSASASANKIPASPQASTATAVPPSTPTLTATPTQVPTPTPSPTATATPAPTATLPPTVTPVTGPLAPLITQGHPETGMIALTFDMGVSGAGDSAKVLDVLRNEHISSTFFLTGVWAEANPTLARRIVTDGHEIGNHTYDHPDLTQISDAAVTEEMQKTEAIVLKAAGKTTRPYMRPPSGAYDKRVLALMSRLGYTVIYWTLDSTDWRDDSTVESEINWVTSKAKLGDIIVFHGYSPKTAAALPAIIEALKAKGYRFGTVTQVLSR